MEELNGEDNDCENVSTDVPKVVEKNRDHVRKEVSITENGRLPGETMLVLGRERTTTSETIPYIDKGQLSMCESASHDLLNKWIEALICDDLESVKVMLKSAENR